MPKNQYRIISLGGSIVIPPEGFNIEFLKKFRELILKRVEVGEKFILVIGGGSTCRKYQKAAKESANVTDIDLDWLGIYATHFNARFVGLLFNGRADPELIVNPTKKVRSRKSILVAGGWKPGCSTDYDAVLLAKTYGAQEVINLSNIDYIYDADPRENSQAKKMENLTWDELRKIVGDKWIPGANLPFDPVAAKTAQKLGLTVKFAKGTDLSGLKDVLDGKTYQGSLIK
ncbi:MAG: uridylate kinase [Parcubacteria group bacterium Gr01-1014_13]|nr:MAG: uridylate kinase [Parcubacteria group bacterium Gr01-1014_13]